MHSQNCWQLAVTFRHAVQTLFALAITQHVEPTHFAMAKARFVEVILFAAVTNRGEKKKTRFCKLLDQTNFYIKNFFFEDADPTHIAQTQLPFVDKNVKDVMFGARGLGLNDCIKGCPRRSDPGTANLDHQTIFSVYFYGKNKIL